MTVVQITTDNREPFREYAKLVPWFGTAPAALLEGFALRPEVKVHVVSCTQRPMSASPEKLAPNIWFHSIHVAKPGWLRTGYAGCVLAVRRKVRELAPDIVHGQGTERECGLSAVFSGFPNVVTVHGNMRAVEAYYRHGAERLFHWSAARLETLTLRRTSGVFCNSAYTEALVAPQARKTWRVSNSVRQCFFTASVAGMPSQPPVLLNIGVISKRKRQLEVLALAEKLHAAGHRFHLHFLGPADAGSAYGREFFARLQPAEAAGWAKYLGSLEDSQLLACFDKASALLHFPSEEAFGLVVAEALARNLKLFATRVGGIIDIAGGVDSADLVGEDDWDEAFRLLARWLADGTPRPLQAAAVMAARYHPEFIVQQHLQIYREVLADRA